VSAEGLREVARRIVNAAIAAADPAAAVARALSATPEGLAACGRAFPLEGRLFVVAVGKASQAMAAPAIAALEDRLTGGIVVLPRGYGRALGACYPRIAVLEARHPLPDAAGMEAAGRVMALVRGMGERDLCLFLLSGGGSSLLPLPHPRISLEDKIETTRLLLRSGADITETNTVRTHISAIKGGRLAEGARGCIVTLAISDVAGDALGFIASGPTVPDPTTFAEALDVLSRRGLGDRVPGRVRLLLEDGAAGRIAETPKSLPDRHAAEIVASNATAVSAAMREAAAAGFTPHLLTAPLAGEARNAGRMLARIAKDVRDRGVPVAPPACVLAGGETTVTVKGSGAGGRNQETTLAAAIALEGEPGILLASFATDGVDGPTESAGAYASGETAVAGRRAGLDPLACLADNDSAAFLSAAGELIVTGPTGTNVNDIAFALVARRT